MIRKNHRRKGDKRTEHGPRWENGETDRGSARGRARWKRLRARIERRERIAVVGLGSSRRVGSEDGGK